MKKIILIFVILFSTLMLSSNSYSGWEKVSEGSNGNSYYVDYDRVKIIDGYVYFWTLTDLIKPDNDGDLSYQIYLQGDCKLFRVKGLTEWYFKEPMGRGNNGKENYIEDPKWHYPRPESISESTLKSVCSR